MNTNFDDNLLKSSFINLVQTEIKKYNQLIKLCPELPNNSIDSIDSIKEYNHFLIVKLMMLYIKIFKQIPPENIWQFKKYLNCQYTCNEIQLKDFNNNKYTIKNYDKFVTNNSIIHNLNTNYNLNYDPNNIILIGPNGHINNTYYSDINYTIIIINKNINLIPKI
jgi:hypothetical protein